MKLYKIMSIFLLVGMLLAACVPGSITPSVNRTPTASVPSGAATSTQPAAPGATSPVQPSGTQPPAALAAQNALAQQLGIAAEQVKIVSAEQTQWNSGCLGLQKPDEMCTDMLVDGYKVILTANGKQYEFHTNNDGTQMRMAEGPVLGGTPVAPPSGETLPAVTAARQTLAQQLGANLGDIKTVQVEQVEWPNGCLGVQMPGKMCTQMITPGYKVVFEVNGKQYEFHTDETGAAVIQAMAPLPKTADKLVVWEQTDGGACSRAEIGPQGVAYGPCAGPLKETQLQPNRAEELRYLLSTYKTFTGGTKAGTVQFNGQGQQEPTEAEMRSVAEWAKLVNMEAQGGRGGAAWGLAFSWHREGGIAGFCNDLGVYLNGWAQPSTCKAGQAKGYPEYHLTADQLAQMYAWVDKFQNFEYSQQDAATTDAMKITLMFSGTGTEKATADQQKQIADFAAQVYGAAAR